MEILLILFHFGFVYDIFAVYYDSLFFRFECRTVFFQSNITVSDVAKTLPRFVKNL